MATPSQIHANQQNAQYGTHNSSRESHLLPESFLSRPQWCSLQVLDWEDQNAFDELSARLKGEHQPDTVTEEILVEKVTQHFWLSQRAIKLQSMCFDPEMNMGDHEKQLALYLRYQTTHERAFHRCLNDLLKLRAEKRKQEIGFECGTCKIPTIGSGEVLVGQVLKKRIQVCIVKLSREDVRARRDRA